MSSRPCRTDHIRGNLRVGFHRHCPTYSKIDNNKVWPRSRVDNLCLDFCRSPFGSRGNDSRHWYQP